MDLKKKTTKTKQEEKARVPLWCQNAKNYAKIRELEHGEGTLSSRGKSLARDGEENLIGEKPRLGLRTKRSFVGRIDCGGERWGKASRCERL